MAVPRAFIGSRSHRYSLYGLVLESSYEIDGLPEACESEPTIELGRGDASIFAKARGEAGCKDEPSDSNDWFWHTTLADGSDYLRWTGHFEFLVDREGLQIAFLELDGASYEALQVYLLGQVLSFALLKRGIEPLHATTVVVDGAAVAFVGDSGAGKSTLAASFLAAGYPLLTDDLLVLDQREDGLFGFPGMPRIKLYPEAAEALLPRSAAGIEMNQWTPKRIVPLVADQFFKSPAPLSAIFLLASGGPGSDAEGTATGGDCDGDLALLQPEIERLASRRAFLELLENTYNPLVDDSRRLRRQFHQLASWVGRIPLATLRGPRGLGRVGELRDAILDHLAASQ